MTATKVAVIVILIVAAVARFWSIGGESYWIDELFTLETSAGNGLAHERIPGGIWLDPSPPPTTELGSGGGVAGIVRNAREDTQAPLYFIALNGWRHVFGSSERAVRALSAICSLAAVAAIGAMLRHLSPRGALLAMALAAVSGTQIVYAQEARPYAMGLLFVLFAAVAIVTIERRGFSMVRGAALGASLLAMMLTHYTGAAPAVALLLYAIIRLRGRDRIKTAAIFAIAACGFALIWGPILLAQRREATDRLVFLNDNPAGHTFRTLDRALCEPLSMLLAAPSISQQSPAWRWIARVTGLVLLLAPLPLLRRDRAMLLPWLLLIFPIAQCVIADFYYTRAALELPRFSFLASAGAITTAAVLISALHDKRAALVVGSLVVAAEFVILIAPSIFGRPSAYDRGKPDIRLLAEEIHRAAKPGEVLVLARAAREPWQAGALLCGIDQHNGAWRGPLLVLDAPADSQMLPRLRTAPGVWILSPTPSVPSALLPGSQIDAQSLRQVKAMGTAARVKLTEP